MQATTCCDIKINGRRCKSPSLGLSPSATSTHASTAATKNLLENSSAVVETTPNPSKSTSGTHNTCPLRHAASIELDLPPLEDVESIQVSISLLIAALARNRITSKRAVLLYSLQPPLPTCAPSPSNPLPPPSPVISSAPNQASTSRFANSVPLKMTWAGNQKPDRYPRHAD